MRNFRRSYAFFLLSSHSIGIRRDRLHGFKAENEGRDEEDEDVEVIAPVKHDERLGFGEGEATSRDGHVEERFVYAPQIALIVSEIRSFLLISAIVNMDSHMKSKRIDLPHVRFLRPLESAKALQPKPALLRTRPRIVYRNRVFLSL